MTEIPATITTDIDPEIVAILPGNPNAMGPDEFSRLCGGIERLGFLQSLTVRPVKEADRKLYAEITDAHEYIVTDGEHRLRAAIRLRLRLVPAVIAEHSVDEAAIAQISMNRLRGQLDMTRVGRVLDDLITEGWKMDDLEIVGFSALEIKGLLEATREDPIDDLLDDSTAAPDLSDKPTRFTLTINCKSETVRAKIRAGLLEAAGEEGDILDGLCEVLDINR